VAIIAGWIVDHLPGYEIYDLRERVVNWSLVHDLPELVTGDIPTPIKELIRGPLEEVERKLFPRTVAYGRGLGESGKAICKAADLIDAIQFATKFCVDSRKEVIITEMLENLNNVTSPMLDRAAACVLRGVIEDLCKNEKMF
jgi:hypothetical protein